MIPPRRAGAVATWLRCLLVVVVLLLAAPLAATSAPVQQLESAAARDAAPWAVEVVQADAEPNFPEGVSFTFTATSAEPVERVELLYRAAGDETLRLETPSFEPGETITITHEVDLRNGSLPPGIDVVYHWRLIDAAGDAVETAERTLLWADDRFDWQPLPGERVTVYAYNGDAAYTRGVLEAAERTIDRLAADYGARVTEPIRIWVYDSLDDLSGALRPNTEPWVAGAAYPEQNLIHAVLPVSDAGEIGRIVPHEISHLVLHQATDNPFAGPPTWLDEGLAVAAQEVVFQADLDLVAEAAVDGDLQSIRVLSAPFPYNQRDARLAYAQSLSLVLFLRETYGDDGIARLIDAFAAGVTLDQGVARALDVTVAELEATWRASIANDEQELPAGATVADEGAGGLDLPQAIALASGALIMGLAAVLAVISGGIALSRSRRAAETLDAEA